MNETTNAGSMKKNEVANPKSPEDQTGNGLQEKIMKQIQELGDSIERAGEKVEKNGWETIGQAIYKLGDKLEHLNGRFKGKTTAQPH